MGSRNCGVVLVVAALLLALGLPGAALAQGKGNGKGKGQSHAPAATRGKLTVEGIVTALSTAANAFTLQISKPGHQKRAGAESITVVLQTGTQIKVRGAGDDDDDDDDDQGGSRRAAAIGDLHVGDRVQVQGTRLDDGSILAQRLDVKNRAAAGGTQPSGGGGAVASGVVTAKAANSMSVVGSDGVTRIVLVGPGTSIRGQRNSFAEIQPSDVVNVQGTVNADGTISASRIEVTFGTGTTMSGQITAKSGLGAQLIVLNGVTPVHISGDTRILGGGQVRSFADLQVGQTVTVSGTPITVGGVTVGINARVITF